MKKASKHKLGYVGSKPGSRDSNAWFTPDVYLNAARSALGGSIDLDPFSSEIANTRVRAKVFFTEQTDAFKQDWSAVKAKTCFMNPPYSASLARDAVLRFVAEYQRGAFAAGIVLVNNATETKWFQLMLREAAAVCFTDHRIAFWNADDKAVSGNTRGQAFLYFGENPGAFAAEFAAHGAVLHGPRRSITSENGIRGG